jgi:hypothetical protein
MKLPQAAGATTDELRSKWIRVLLLFPRRMGYDPFPGQKISRAGARPRPPQWFPHVAHTAGDKPPPYRREMNRTPVDGL